MQLTREDSFHLHHARVIGGPHSAEPSSVVRVQIGNAKVEVGDVQRSEKSLKVGVGREFGERRVRPGAVAVPEIDQSIRERLTGLDVDDTNVQPERHANLVFGHILTESLGARPDVGAAGDLGSQNAGVVLDGVVVWGLRCDFVGGVPARRLPALLDIPLVHALSVHLANAVRTLFCCKAPGLQLSRGEPLLMGSVSDREGRESRDDDGWEQHAVVSEWKLQNAVLWFCANLDIGMPQTFQVLILLLGTALHKHNL